MKLKRARCRGVAAIEAALVLAALAPLLALALNMGRLAIDGDGQAVAACSQFRAGDQSQFSAAALQRQAGRRGQSK